jgi:hypothetical protein
MRETFHCGLRFLGVFSFLGKLIDIIIENFQFEVSHEDRVIRKTGNNVKLEVSKLDIVGVANLGKTMLLNFFEVKFGIFEGLQVELDQRLELFGGDFGVDYVLDKSFIDFLVVKRVFIATFHLLSGFFLVF